jgi:hypothetical protein
MCRLPQVCGGDVTGGHRGAAAAQYRPHMHSQNSVSSDLLLSPLIVPPAVNITQKAVHGNIIGEQACRFDAQSTE